MHAPVLEERRFARIDPRSRIGDLLGELAAVDAHLWSPWAILLVHFDDDDPAALPPLDHYRQLFTSAGAGTTLNMVEFFADMSHGRVDLSGSQVFGWLRLPVTRSQYVGNVYPQPPGQVNRNGLLDLARAAATASGVNLPDFAGVCVSGFGTVDLCGWVGGMAALCDSNSLQPSVLGQEMGHGYGLDHARLEGSTADYQDPWDVMSTAVWPDQEADDPNYVKVGPGLNAWSMRSRSWLNESRVWKPANPGAGYDVTIDLRPLHDRHLTGYLAAELGKYLVEFRVPERWDAAFEKACVFVHRFEDNHSYLQRAQSGQAPMVEGDRFVDGLHDATIVAYFEAEVQRIDAAGRVATVRLHYRPAGMVHVPELVGHPHVGDPVIVHLPGGDVVSVPSHAPIGHLLGHALRYHSIELKGDIASALAARRAALTDVMRSALALHAEAEDVTETPPGFTEGRGG